MLLGELTLDVGRFRDVLKVEQPGTAPIPVEEPTAAAPPPKTRSRKR
jgi:hypothetical protein